MYHYDYPLYPLEEPSRNSNCINSLVRAVVQIGREFCRETSIHGFNHIAAARRHWFERILWVAATALAAWGALDVSLGQLQRYNESPTVVTLEKDFRSWRYSLPAVTFCFVDRVDPTKLPEVIKKYWDVDPTDEKYEYYVRFVRAIANSDLFHLQAFEEFSDVSDEIDMHAIALYVMPEPQIKTKSSEVKVEFKWVPVFTEAGACYVTNSLAIADVAIEPNNLTTEGLPVTCKYWSQSCYIIMHVTSPGDFYIHSPYDIVDMAHAPSKVFLSLNRNTELSVMESRCGKGVEELQPKRRGCFYTDEPTACGRQVYSTNTCRLSCRSRVAVELCGCVPFYYFYEEGPKCTASGMWCLAGKKHELSNNNGERCACAPQCMDCVYEEIYTFDEFWTREPFKAHGSVKFTVQAPRTRYTREIVFHFQDLVVSFGGAAGLFLGASFISFVEILYFILVRFLRIIIVRTEEKRTATVFKAKVKEVSMPPESLRIKHLTSILDGEKQYENFYNRPRFGY